MVNSRRREFLQIELLIDTEDLKGLSADDLEFKIVEENDIWLAKSYELLVDQFDIDVLDPIERYVEWLGQNSLGINKFPYLLVAAYLKTGEKLFLVGVVSGNVMKIEEYVGHESSLQKNRFIFAIGHQVTAKALRTAGVKGIGTKLWNYAVERASEIIRERGGSFEYSFLEAETESLGFWSRLGYLWPKGMDYWQPPLEFDETGQYLHPEVTEIPLLKPIEADKSNAIEPTMLKNLIATVYYNWALVKYKTSLTPEAFKKAEDYVMGEVFDRVCQTIPNNGSVKLIAYERKN